MPDVFLSLSFLLRLQPLQGRIFSARVRALRASILSCCDQSSPTHFLPSDSGAVFQTLSLGLSLSPSTLNVSCLPAYITELFPLLSLPLASAGPGWSPWKDTLNNPCLVWDCQWALLAAPALPNPSDCGEPRLVRALPVLWSPSAPSSFPHVEQPCFCCVLAWKYLA